MVTLAGADSRVTCANIVLVATGKPAAAAAAFERALVFGAADPATLHLTLATLYTHLGDRAQAE